MSYDFVTITPTNLALWQKCPKKFEYEKLSPKVPFGATDATRFGNRIHTAMEKAIRDGRPLPDDFNGTQPDMDNRRVNLTPYVAMVQGLVDAGASVQVEQWLAVDQLGRPCKSKSSQKFISCRDDCSVFKPGKAVSYDWKSGRYSVEYKGKIQPGWDQQLRIQAELMYAHYPDVQEHTGFLVFVAEQRISPAVKTTRGNAYTQQIVDDMGKYTEAFKTAYYPPKENNLCREHCPVKTCPFNGEYGK